MNEKMSLVVLIGGGLLLLFVLISSVSIGIAVDKASQDLNVLKQNDLVLGQLIYNEQYWSKFVQGCIQTKDNNTTIELVCKK